MKKSSFEQGFTLVETLLVVLVVAIIGFGGYYVYQTQSDDSKAQENSGTKDKQPTGAATKPASDKEQIAKLIDETCPGEGATIVADAEQTVIDGSWARVAVGCEAEGGGFMGFLYNKSGEWYYTLKTQDTPSCSEFDESGVPASILDECYDDATSSMRAPTPSTAPPHDL